MSDRICRACGREDAISPGSGVRSWLGAALLAAALLLVPLGGCSPYRRYRVLSLFFDGVPDPNRVERPAESRGGGAMPVTNEERVRALGYQVEGTSFSVHQPVVEEKCAACHRMAHSVGARSGAMRSVRMRSVAGFRLPPDKLCTQCHDFENAFGHGPAASGYCGVCHWAHRSPNRHLLRYAEVRYACLLCHDGTALEERALHEPGDLERDCLECHNPHGSDQRYMIREGVKGDDPGGDGRERP